VFRLEAYSLLPAVQVSVALFVSLPIPIGWVQGH
jgi:hypothetical protein